MGLLLALPAFAEAEPATQYEWQMTWKCQDHHVRQFEFSVYKIAMGAGEIAQMDIGYAELYELIGAQMWAGMSPSPDTRSIVLYKNGRQQILEVFLYDTDPRVEDGHALAMRHTRVGVSEARAAKFMRDTAKLRSGLKSAPASVCSVAAILEIMIGARKTARRYSRDVCIDRSRLDDLSAELMSLAIELGPGLASYADTMTLDLGPQ